MATGATGRIARTHPDQQARLEQAQKALREAEQAVAKALLALARALDSSPRK